MADTTDDEVTRIVDAWKRIMNIKLNPAHVKDSLRKLREWEARTTKTINAKESADD